MEPMNIHIYKEKGYITIILLAATILALSTLKIMYAEQSYPTYSIYFTAPWYNVLVPPWPAPWFNPFSPLSLYPLWGLGDYAPLAW